MKDEQRSRDTVTVIRVDHQVAVDEFTGGASIDVPVPLTAARALTPQLVLRWGGGGNSVVGRGWSLGGLPAITIDASEHLPRWDGSDGFALGGVPLVVWRADDGTPRRRIDGDYQVTDLRPRGGFTRVRVEHWVHRPTGAVHFRSRDEADALTVFGARPDGAAQIADPDAPRRIAAWLPEVMVDPAGNAAWCEYAAEDRRGIDRTAPWEPRRPSMAQRYLTRVRYGNVAPVALTADVLAGALPAVRFAFALVVDHGDHGDADGVPTFDPDRAWPARQDVFASARNGFSVRTYRRVRRLVCFHDLPALGATPVAVSALELGYDDDPAGAQLRTVRRVGYRDGVRATSAPLTVSYAAPGVEVSELATTSAGVVGAGKELVDLYGEGLPGVLYRGDRGWLYRANRGGGRFTEPALVGARPSLEQGAALGDRDRDGDTELAITAGVMAGAFALEREDARWRGFRTFARWPKIEAVAGHTYWIDLNGDGRADAVVARGDALVWFPSRTGPLDERDGEFDDAITVPLPTGSDRAPGGVPDPSLGLTFADLDGDGLPDLVRVQRGGVEYWPSLGNGRFGERMILSGAAELGQLADFDHRRVRWVDLDGSGTADLVYLRHGEVWLWPNLGGRRFGPLQVLRSLPQFDARTAMITDVAGQGRPSLVWTTPDLGRGTTLSYVPLAPAIAPGTVTAIDDGCGRRTELTWGSSATHYLRDAAEGVPWETRLPSHRAVVDARVERDLIGASSVTTRYRYRDGFYDGATGAFRGFGRVETLDTPAVGATPEGTAFAPPLLTRTWFHLGTPMRNHHRPFEPYTGDASLAKLPAHVDLPGLQTPADHAAAQRLLAGAMVRRERWAVDADERPTAHPFDVEQVSYQLVRVQARHGRARPVFAQLARERMVAAYEGNEGAPRVTHEVVVAFDPWGAPTRTATVAYARRDAVDDPAQARTWVTVAETQRTSVDAPAQFVLGLVVEETQFELTGVAAAAGRITPAALASVPVSAALAASVPFEQALDPGAVVPAARRLSWRRTYYWSDARDAAAPLGEVGRTPRRHHVDEACLTPGLIAATLGPRIDDAQLAALGYVAADGHWWAASPREDLAGPFALATGTYRGDGAATQIVYDADWLSPVSSTDALGLTTEIAFDPITLQPATTTDPNGAVAEVVHDRFGRIVATGIVGHIGAEPWSSGTTAGWQEPAAPGVAQILTDPLMWLGSAATATWIDDRAWERDGTPIAEITVARSALASGGVDADAPVDVRVRYVDGFGRVLQEKVRVEAGPAITRGPQGDVLVDGGGRPVLTHSATRWRVSGHVVFDAKGQPGRVFEPHFSPSAGYEGDAVLEHFGVSTLTTFDALGRALRVDLPNGSYARTRHAAWSTETANPSDTVQDSVYRALREGRPADDPERAAYQHAAVHAETPVISMVDARGLTCAMRAVGDATAATMTARTVLDATGQAAALVDGRGLEAFTYARDLRGQVLAQQSVDAGATWALADAYNRAVCTWDARGVAVERRFDRADRPVAVHVRGGDATPALDALVETYRYGDELTDRAAAIAANALGRVILVHDEAGELEVASYDPLGAVRTRTRRLRALLDDAPDWRGDIAVDAEPFTTATRTDALGRTVWTQLADGTIRREAFHPGGALATVQLTTPDGALVDAPIVSGLARDAHGRIAAATLGNGCVQAWRYDVESGRLAAQDAAHDGRALQALRYTYDPDGKLVRALDLAQEGPGALVPGAVSARRDYRYDAHARLLEATGRVHQALLPASVGWIHGARHISLDDGAALERYRQRFQWDPAGNLARVQHIGATASWATDYWISPTSNRASPAVDDNGNPIIAPETLYDAGGNLTQLWHLRALGYSWRACLTHAVTVARAAGPVDDGERYTYASDRVRVRKLATRLVVGGTSPVIETREVVYLDGGQERVRVRRGDQLVLERFTTHVSDGDRRVAVIDRHVVDTLGHEVDAIGPARVRYHLTTAQGSTALELDELARLISYEEYLPHGGSAFIAGDSVREVSRRDVRYAGKERDRATGLHAYPQRYYAPWLGRWLTPDPIGPEDGLNLYAFVGGDPIGYVDPQGTDREDSDPPKTEWLWSFDDEGNPHIPHFWNGTAWEAWWGAEPSEVIEIVDSAPTPEQQAAYDKRLFGNREEMIGILHQVQKAQWHQEAANELAGLAIEKWGYGKYRDYLGGYDFGAVTESVRPGEVAPLLGNVENYLAAVGEAKEPSAFANASAGFGNGITFGLIGWANRKAGLDTNYSESSDAFRYGNYGGAAAGLVLTGGASALEHGVARTAAWMGVGAGTGFGVATLQTGADMLDGKDVTWGGYLEHAGISTLYGAYGGTAFGLAGPTARTTIGVVGSGAQLGEGAYQISGGNYARGTLDLGLGGLGGYLTLRPTPSIPANRISQRDLLEIGQPDDVAAVLDRAAVPTAAEIRSAAAAGDETAQALVGQFDRAAARQAATLAEHGDIGAIASADATGTTMGPLARGQILAQADEALAPLAKEFPDAQVGIRGSLARGTKGPHKGNAPFDPTDFDVDAFIVSDKLAGMVAKNAQGFRNLTRLPHYESLVRSVGNQLQKIPGIRPDTFKVRVFSEKEFEAAVKANERHFTGRGR